MERSALSTENVYFRKLAMSNRSPILRLPFAVLLMVCPLAACGGSDGAASQDDGTQNHEHNADFDAAGDAAAEAAPDATVDASPASDAENGSDSAPEATRDDASDGAVAQDGASDA